MKVYWKLFSILFVGLISGCSSLMETEEIPEAKKKVEIYAGFTEWMNVPVKECRGYKDQLLIPANFDMKNFLTKMTAPSCAALSGYDTKSIVMSDGVNLKNLKQRKCKIFLSRSQVNNPKHYQNYKEEIGIQVDQRQLELPLEI